MRNSSSKCGRWLSAPSNGRMSCAASHKRPSSIAVRSCPRTLMSVKRRTRLASPDSYTSTRFRPRSLAALQAVSAAASECISSPASVSSGATPMLSDTSRRDPSCELLCSFAQRFGELRGGVQLGRQRHRETIAGDARRERSGRQPQPDELPELAEYRVPDVHPEAVVDDMQPIHVDVQGGPMPQAPGGGHHQPQAPLECRPVVQTAQGVVADLDDADRLAREDSRQPGIALGKELAEILAKQRQYPDGLADGGAQGAREDLVWKDAHGAVGRQLVDDDGPVSYLRQRQQLPVSAGHELRILSALVLRVLRAQQRNALVRDDQSGRGSAHLLDRLHQDPLQLIPAVARGLVCRAVAEQQLEIPVARFDGAIEPLDRGARQQLAAQALEHRSQEGVGDGEGAGT